MSISRHIIAIFGGSFNPPTISHINLAKQIIKKIDNIEKVVFVPVSTKYNKKGLASDEIRFNMLKKICDENKKLEVSSIELDSSRQLYTIETLRNMKTQYIEKEIYFIIGTDNLKELETWHRADELLQEFKVLVLERDDDIMEDIISKSSFLEKHRNAFVKLKDIERIDMSASYIRERIKQGKPIKGMVPEEIEKDVIKIYS